MCSGERIFFGILCMYNWLAVVYNAVRMRRRDRIFGPFFFPIQECNLVLQHTHCVVCWMMFSQFLFQNEYKLNEFTVAHSHGARPDIPLCGKRRNNIVRTLLLPSKPWTSDAPSLRLSVWYTHCKPEIYSNYILVFEEMREWYAVRVSLFMLIQKCATVSFAIMLGQT